MSRCKRIAGIMMLSLSVLAAPAMAETLHCQSINGNLNCAGSNGVSCQTVDGKKVCVSGHGDVVQSFGGASQGNTDMDGDETMPAPHQRIERHDQNGQRMILQRDGSHLHVQTNWISIDRD